MYKEKIAALRSLLFHMEEDLGLNKLSYSQRDVYYAACLAANGRNFVHKDDIYKHPMLQTIHTTKFVKLLKDLVSEGYLIPAGNPRSGQYIILQ